MAVSMRVVGILFQAKDVQYDQNMTVKDLMDKVAKNPALYSDASNFGYIAVGDMVTPNNPSVVAFAARYPKGITSTTSNTKYIAGDYYLAESNVGNPRYSVWQYYVFNEAEISGESRQVFSPNPKQLQSFGTREINDGDTVIWRLVEILSGPNTIPRVYQGRLGFGGGQRSVYGYITAQGGGTPIIQSGSGIASVSREKEGVYTIEFATPFTRPPAVNATQQFNVGGINPGKLTDNAIVTEITAATCTVATGEASGKPSDRNFSFEATGF
jgi:hypothetical protein